MSIGRVVIVGAGPCGLACARRLITECGATADVLVLEATDRPGGLAASVIDTAGFTWDRGGHVVFSHYGEFDDLLAEVMGDDIGHHDRSSFVRIAGTWVPYPFQHNLHHLPTDLAAAALVGLIDAQTTPTIDRVSGPVAHDDGRAELDFSTWIDHMFGAGIGAMFMRPYNEKVWAHPASSMSSRWIAERVATVDWRLAVHAAITRTDHEGWGPNNMFAFPVRGGTGEIYRRAAATITDHIRYSTSVLCVDADRRRLTTGCGDHVDYDHLVWTGPLDRLVAGLVSAPAEVRSAGTELVHNSVTVVGLGYESPLTDDRSWLYFPEPDVPFYRATNFAKYAANNVPGGRTDRYSSWMTEVASSPWRPCSLDDDQLVQEVDRALRDVGLVPPDAPVVSRHVDHIEYAYPVPTLGRDRALETIQPWLAERSILSRGRFGAWKYEMGNMDHAVKMGHDVARRLSTGVEEEAWS